MSGVNKKKKSRDERRRCCKMLFQRIREKELWDAGWFREGPLWWPRWGRPRVFLPLRGTAAGKGLAPTQTLPCCVARSCRSKVLRAKLMFR